jgi:glycosyltransferase involved in cell wall biosynthesis
MGRVVYDQVMSNGFNTTLITSFSSQEINTKYLINFFTKHSFLTILLSLWATFFWIIFNRLFKKHKFLKNNFNLLNRLTLLPIYFFKFDLIYVLDQPDLWTLRLFKRKGTKIILEQAIYPTDMQLFLDVLDIVDIVLCPSQHIYKLSINLIENNSYKIKCNAYLISYTSGAICNINDINVPNNIKNLINFDTNLKLLFVGNDPVRKGLDQIVEAVKKTNKFSKNKIILLIVGNINLNYINKYKEKDENIIIIGPKPNNIVRWLMTKSDLLILLSLAEGSPIVLHEALELNLPFIATLECGDIVSACSNLVVKRDIDMLNRLLIKINKNKDILLQTKKNMKIFCEKKLNNNLIGDVLAKIYLNN